MFWKMTNLQLKKGYVFSPYGDSAPFLGRFAEKRIYLINRSYYENSEMGFS